MIKQFASALVLLLALAPLAFGGFNPATNDTQTGPTPPPTVEVTTGEPIDVINGAVVHDANDIAIPAPGFDLILRRHYSSQETRTTLPSSGGSGGIGTASRVDGAIGVNWVHTLDPRLVPIVNDTLQGQYGHWLDFSVGDGGHILFLLSSDVTLYFQQLDPDGSGYYPIRPRADAVAPTNLPAWTDAPAYRLTMTDSGWRIDMPGQRSINFNVYGFAVTLRNEAGQSIAFSRSGDTGPLAAAIHSSGQRINFEYNIDGRVSRAYVPGTTLLVEYEYDPDIWSNNGERHIKGDGSLIGVKRTTSAGVSWRYYTYNSSRNLIRYTHTPTSRYSISDPAAHNVYFSYTNLPPLHTEEPERMMGATTHVGTNRAYESRLVYPELGRTIVSLPRGDQIFDTTYRYQISRRQPLTVEYPTGETNSTTYDGYRLPTGSTLVSASGNRAAVNVQWDANDHPVRIDSGYNLPAGVTGAVWQTTWVAATRQPATSTDPCGRLSGADYDSAARPRTNWVELAPGTRLAERFDYGANGLLSNYHDPAGRSVSFAYGPGDYVTNVTAEAGPAVSYGWNTALGILTNVTLPGPAGDRTTAFDCDELGRTRRVTLPGGLGSADFAYDFLNHLTNATDSAGRQVRQTWHTTGQLASHSRYAGNGQWATVTFDYDQQMDALRIRDPLGRDVERYALDAVGRATNVWDIENRPMAIRYALGNLVASIDRFDGSTVSFDYDTGARLTRAHYPDGDDLAFTYQACGRPATASNAVSQIAWFYDGAGRQTNETALTSLGASSLSWQLDASGLSTNTHLSVERCALNVERSFDTAARLATQATEAGLFTWSYTPWNGLPAAITNATSGIYATYAYDLLDRPTNIVWRAADGNLLTRFGYAYNAASLITNRVIARVALPVMNAAYSYDLLDRLTAEVTNGVGVTTTYDLAGNRLTRGGVTNSYATVNGLQTDRLATYGPDSFAYDAAGNLTNAVRNGVAWRYIWNARYQLTGVSSNGVPVESYAYDPLGRRISTSTRGNVTWHVYDGPHVIADLTADGTPLRSYTYAPGIDQMLAVTLYSGGTTSTLHTVIDHQGTVHALADSSGNIVESYDYDAWGNILAVRDASSTVIPQSAHGNRYLFQGREFSWASGLHYFRARWYDPATGRWLSNDPIGISGGINQYVFCRNNPVNLADPSGDITKDEHYSRNMNQAGKLPGSLAEAKALGWNGNVPANFHQQGKGAKGNTKWVSPDGKSEAVFDSLGEPVTDVINMGTYNYGNPTTEKWTHFFDDMLPYFIWGNGPEDPTTILQRITASYDGPIPPPVAPGLPPPQDAPLSKTEYPEKPR